MTRSRFKSPSATRATPPHGRAMRIGLLGGSFNPPHAAHTLISLAALKRLGLDCVWWLVTPGNPLKDNRDLPAASHRRALARQVAAHPRIKIVLLEDAIGTRYTYETLAWLSKRHPELHFVWLMGADNLSGFHRWARWRDIAKLMPIAIVDRPGFTLRPLHARAALAFQSFRIPECDALLLPTLEAPAWVFLHGPRSPLSSTALRARGSDGKAGIS